MYTKTKRAVALFTCIYYLLLTNTTLIVLDCLKASFKAEVEVERNYKGNSEGKRKQVGTCNYTMYKCIVEIYRANCYEVQLRAG